MRLKSICLYFGISLFLTACKYSVPPEMLMGNWYVSSVKANDHEMIKEYLDHNTRYLVFEQEGTYQVGLLDSVSTKTWMINPDKNELIMMQGSPFSNIKIWNIKASDEVVYLSDKSKHFNIVLKKVKSLPAVQQVDAESLIGKWIIDKVTVNGANNTDTYAHSERWFLLSKNGRFYNGSESGDQNVGYWKVDESLSKVKFFWQEEQQDPFITFNITNRLLWYEKQSTDYSKPEVRVYFKKTPK